MKVVVIWDGVDSCHIAFLSMHVIAQRLHCKFAQILELYDSNVVGHVRKDESDHMLAG
jgi:hypothetical protein